MALKAELEASLKATTMLLIKESSEIMNCEWTLPNLKPLMNILAAFKEWVKNEKLVPKDTDKDADQLVREERQGSLPPPLPTSKLGTSKSTSCKRTKVTSDQPVEQGSGGGSGSLKNTGKVASSGDLSDSSYNTDSDASDNEWELLKVKIISEKLLAKYISVIIKD